MSGLFETPDEKIARLQAALAEVQTKLTQAEAELTDRMVGVDQFEREFEVRVGSLMDELTAVEEEVKDYLDRIRMRRENKTFGIGYVPVEEQYRERWTKPPPKASSSEPIKSKPAPQSSIDAITPAEMKKLYRTLTKQYHPDLAEDDEDRIFRTEQMSAINEAYAAKDGIALQQLVQGLETMQFRREAPPTPLTKEEIIKNLRDELNRKEHRLQRIKVDLQTLHNRSSVKLSLEAKFARREGRDLIGEIINDYQRKIARKTAERDMLRSQFENL
jgi:hypothetical protein